jgi:hypothetical protein
LYKLCYNPRLGAKSTIRCNVMTQRKGKNDLDTTEENADIFSDLKYICNSTSLIVDSLRKGLDVAQLPSGDIIITEIKTVNTKYSWDKDKQRMIKNHSEIV